MKFSLSLCLILLPSIAFADARNGELFGYKIGDVYPVTESTIESTMGQWNEFLTRFDVISENPQKPKNIGEVSVLITMKSYTILYIGSETKFDSYDKAKSFAIDCEKILIAKYNLNIPWDSPDRLHPRMYAKLVTGIHRGDIDTSLLDLNDGYRLEINVNQKIVSIGLTPKVGSSLDENYKNWRKLNGINYS
jgi:hypothetical protein